MSGVMNMLLGARTAIAVAVDEFFNRVTLLLPGDGTNGAQNNTFLDSSTNNFTITRNGNTTQGTFSPFSQTGWSNFFNSATPDYLTLSNNAAFDFGTSDVTIEAWVYITSFSNTVAIFSAFPASGTITGYTLFVNTSGFVAMDTWVSGTEQIITATNNALSLNTWNHIAYTRASGTSRLFVNGNSCTFSGSISQAINTGGNIEKIGYQGYAGFPLPFAGYISNVRVTKGGALYTAAFTPSTIPLTTTVSAGTVSLLTCQSNRFIDTGTANSGQPFSITVNGSPSVQAFSPFAPTIPYSAATVGGSGYFDGSGDNLSSASGSSTALGSGDFTVECWYYQTAAGVYGIFGNLESNSDLQWAFVTSNGSGTVRFQGWNTLFLTATEPPRNQWNHIAVSRSGTTMSMFLNGTRVATATNSTNFSATTNITVGGTNGTNNFLGYISNARVVKGSAVYDPTQTSITVPTAPLTSITNTQFLTNFTNAGITDATAKNVLETVGNAQISTTQSKWGGSSISFDGNGDYLLLRNRPLMDLGSSDFTIEFWVYPNSFSALGYPLFSTSNGAKTNALAIEIATSGNIGAYITGVSTGVWGLAQGSMGTLNATSWNHVALVRSSSTFFGYVNGVKSSSLGSSSQAVASLDGFNIGFDGLSAHLNGYLDDLRITRFARYTANFTPPTAAFPTQ